MRCLFGTRPDGNHVKVKEVASLRGSVSWGAAQETAREKIKKHGFFSRAVSRATPQLTERLTGRGYQRRLNESHFASFHTVPAYFQSIHVHIERKELLLRVFLVSIIFKVTYA